MDAGNVEQQPVILLSRKKDNSAGEITSYARFFCVVSASKADMSGLVKCLSKSLLILGVDDILNQDSLLGAKVKR